MPMQVQILIHREYRYFTIIARPFVRPQTARPLFGIERLHALVDGRDASRQVLVAVAPDHEAGVDDHVPELLLRGEPLDALDQVLVAVAVAGDELPDQGDAREAPALVDGVEQRVAHLAELEAREHAARLQHAVRLPQRLRDVAEVADAERDRVQVERVGLHGLGQHGGVGGLEGEHGLLRGG